MLKISFSFDDVELTKNLETLDLKVSRAIDFIVSYHASRGTQIMKTEAPWHDRTGAARSGLHTVSFSGGGKHEIIFAHSVHYGIWLEVKFSGRDEIIMPSVRKTGRELMRSLNGLMGKI